MASLTGRGASKLCHPELSDVGFAAKLAVGSCMRSGVFLATMLAAA